LQNAIYSFSVSFITVAVFTDVVSFCCRFYRLPILPVAVFSVALFTVAVISVADFTVAVFTANPKFRYRGNKGWSQ